MRNYLDRGWVDLGSYNIIKTYLEKGIIPPSLTIGETEEYSFFRIQEGRKDTLIRLKKDETNTI